MKWKSKKLNSKWPRKKLKKDLRNKKTIIKS